MDLGVVFPLLDEFRAHCYRALRLSDSAERDGNGTETQEIGINWGNAILWGRLVKGNAICNEC